jgi:hypothetical protein
MARVAVSWRWFGPATSWSRVGRRRERPVSWSGVRPSSSRELVVSWHVKLGRECHVCGEDRRAMMTRHPEALDGHATICKPCASFKQGTKSPWRRARARGWAHVLEERDGDSAICRECGPVQVNWRRDSQGRMVARCSIGRKVSRRRSGPRAPKLQDPWSGVRPSSSHDLVVSWRVKLGRECRLCGEDRLAMMSSDFDKIDNHALVCRSCNAALSRARRAGRGAIRRQTTRRRSKAKARVRPERIPMWPPRPAFARVEA